MSEHRTSCREMSRKDWFRPDGTPLLADVNTGSSQRIADALEEIVRHLESMSPLGKDIRRRKAEDKEDAAQ